MITDEQPDRIRFGQRGGWDRHSRKVSVLCLSVLHNLFGENEKGSDGLR